ncbi:MAG: hypothetical protein DRH10_00685 [Deltaproteobacteria bacterium]|nr:MAG: hypothetical protein DRH10_00685 [Deltaproteobacteria bacterium]RLC88359.1 MAG: hypothetical protein DRJ03_02900 [Chloroflexota bacterium]
MGLRVNRDGFTKNEQRARNQSRQIKLDREKRFAANAVNLETMRQEGQTGRLKLSQAGEDRRTGMRESGNTLRTRMQQEGQNQRVKQRGANRLANTEKQGQINAEAATIADQRGTERLSLMNDYKRESDIRNLGVDAAKAGVTGSGVENLLNYSGEQQTPSLADVQFPQDVGNPFQGKTLGVYNKKGKKTGERLAAIDTRTGGIIDNAGPLPDGQTEQQPAPFTEDDILFSENALGSNFDPQNPTVEQAKFLDDLYDVNPDLVRALHSRYTGAVTP